jgi:hypothetical protein
MSEQLISRSDDLRQLREEGYELEIRAGHLLIGHVPYVNSERQVKLGKLVSTLTLAGDVTARPDTHVVTFIGDMPCDREGNALNRILAGSDRQQLADGFFVDHTFSSKPTEGYVNYHDKMTAYVRIISAPAQALDPEVTAQTFEVVETPGPDSVFRYLDTASARAGICAATAKLQLGKIAIIGLGGTGAYVLDLLVKSPIEEIHLFDGDRYFQHNAFRSPGASSIEQIRKAPPKVEHFLQQYAPMRRGLIAHNEFIDDANVEGLCGMDFVFLTLDNGPARKLIIERLEEWGISFIDVGMGVFEASGSLGGLVRTTASTPSMRDHVKSKSRIPFGADDGENAYHQNIQIVDLNALNAALAVIKWKKLCGFYLDLEQEHFSVYQIDGNSIISEDRA